ncbi:alpha/beta hydrolase [Candidatus Saccharibacteria bacterium]|nr:alpha/beta hydrolase [Candidatus Saccharibacteria bacterium]
MFEKLIHKLFRVPYTLNIRHRRIQKGATTTYIFIHGIGDTANMWTETLNKLPDNVNYIAVDLLGFGNSPSPRWATYSATVQARSLLATFLKLGIRNRVIVVGHSLGALVAIEFAKRYQILTRQLILCSPPIYGKPSGNIYLSKQSLLRWVYQHATKNPDQIVNAYGLGKQLGVVGNSLDVQNDNVDLFIKSLQSSIINQTTIDDVVKINIPITILYGVFDPLILHTTLRSVSKRNKSIKIQAVATGHTIDKIYQKQLLRALSHTTENKRSNNS